MRKQSKEANARKRDVENRKSRKVFYSAEIPTDPSTSNAENDKSARDYRHQRTNIICIIFCALLLVFVFCNEGNMHKAKKDPSRCRVSVEMERVERVVHDIEVEKLVKESQDGRNDAKSH